MRERWMTGAVTGWGSPACVACSRVGGVVGWVMPP